MVNTSLIDADWMEQIWMSCGEATLSPTWTVTIALSYLALASGSDWDRKHVSFCVLFDLSPPQRI
jgi:hypothetical protein